MKKMDLRDVKEMSFENPVGGFIIEFKDAEDVPDKEYLKLYYDIVDAYEEKDKKFIGMYTRRKEERNFDYPAHFVSYKDDGTEKAENIKSMFKGFINRIKESNNGYDFENTYNEKELIGKRVGVVLREEEYKGKDKNGGDKIKVRVNVHQRYNIDDIMAGNFTVPERRKYNGPMQTQTNNPFANAATQSLSSTPTPPSNMPADDDVPF